METLSAGKAWKSPEGQVKTIATILWIIAFGAIAVGVGNWVLPFVMIALKNTILTGLLMIPAAILLGILTSKKFWLFGRTLLSSIGRWIVGFWQDTDPIGILKTLLEDMKERAQRIDRAILTVKGVTRDLKETIETNERARIDRLKLAQQARKTENPYQFTLQARKAGRLEKSNFTYAQLHKKLEVLLRVLTRMSNAAEFVIEDKADEVFELEKRKKAVNAAYGAMQDAWAVIKGGHTREFFDSTVERLVTNLNNQMGEIDGFMEIAEGFIGTVDLQQGVYEEDALRQLLAWEQKIDSVILGDEKQQLLADASLASDTELGMAGQEQSGRYTKLLGNQE